MNDFVYTTRGLLPTIMGSHFMPIVPPEEGEGALGLLDGETDGFSIDATTYDSITAAAYVGGPVGGTVAVINTGDPTDNLSNVAMDSSNVVQSGTSPKVVNFPSSPYARWSPHNMCLQSQTHNTTWTATTITRTSGQSDPVGGTNAYLHTLTSSSCDFYQSITVVIGNVYTFSFWWKAGTQGSFIRSSLGASGPSAGSSVWFTAASPPVKGTAGVNSGYISHEVTDYGGGWYRIAVTFSPLEASLTFGAWAAQADNSGAEVSGDNYYLFGFQLNRGYTPTPHLVTTSAIRIGIPQAYDPVAAQYGILVEPAATNTLVRSEDFGTTWTPQNVTITTNTGDTTAPDGSSTADKFLNTGTIHIAYILPTIASGTKTFSVYAKQGNNPYIYLSIQNVSTSFGRLQVFDLSDGSIGEETAGSGGTSTVTFVSSSIVAVGDGWYRCSYTCGDTLANSVVYVGLADLKTGNTLAGGGSPQTAYSNTTDTAYFWGAQLETGSVATSYIPTLGSAVVRAADIPSAVTTTFPGSDTNNTIYLDYKPLDVGSGTRYGWAYWKDSSNFYSLAGVTADPTMGNTNAGTPDNTDLGTLVAGTRTQVTIAMKANDADGSQDGAASTGDASITLTTGYTTLYLGTFGTTGSELNGYIYRMVQVPYQRETVNGDLETWRYNS